MSSPSTPGTAPKAMSSRLLTMKFMQRAAASTPTSLSPTPDEPSPKRQKKSVDSPIRPKVSVDSLADQRAIQAALEAEEAKRQAALDKQATEAGDTRWVLSFEDQEKSARAANNGLRIIQTGFSNLDVPAPPQIKTMGDEDFEDRPAMVGRRSFAKFNKALEREQGTLSESDSTSDSDSDSTSEAEESSEADNAEAGEDDPMKEMIRATRQEAAQKIKAERRAKRKAEKAQLEEMSKKRKKKEVKLNTNMTSLTGRQDRPDTRTCFLCGGPHLKLDCPRNQNGAAQKRFFQGGDDGPLPKARKVR